MLQCTKGQSTATKTSRIRQHTCIMVQFRKLKIS